MATRRAVRRRIKEEIVNGGFPFQDPQDPKVPQAPNDERDIKNM